MSIELLRSQKNELLRRIESAGMDPKDFDWETTLSGFEEHEYGIPFRVPKLVYRYTDFYYVFDLNQGKHYAIFSPGDAVVQERRYPGSWNLQSQYFGEWLSYIARETAEQDLWTSLIENAAGLGNPLVELVDSSLSEDEIENLSSKLDVIAEDIDSIFDKTNSIGEQIDFLKSELHRQSKREWLFVFIGVLTTVGTGLVLTPEQRTALVEYFREIIVGIKGMLCSGS